jgi:HEAT repeat protein
MWVSVIIATVVLAPPSENAVRKQEIQRILRVAESTAPDKITETIKRLTSQNPSWQRVIALKSLRAHHIPKATPYLRKLVNDPNIEVSTEALIRLCQFRPTKKLWQRLGKLRERGVSLRRAFQTGEYRGRPIYRTEAAEFLVQSLSHANVYTRLDGALGLVELRQEPSFTVALGVFQELLESGTVHERRLVVHHMYTSYREPRFLPLIKLAQEDQDSSVRRLANNLMERQ